MPDPVDLSEAIAENAAGPKAAAADGVNVQQHDLASQIAADKYLAAKAAAANPGLGLRFRKMVPPGTS